MARAPHHRSAARRPPSDQDDVIELETGDIEGDLLRQLEDEAEPTAIKLPPTKILPADPQRAVPTTIYGPEHLEAPASAETHVLSVPEDEEDTTLPTTTANKPPPPVAEPMLEPAFLIVEKGPGAGTSIPVLDGELTIGRSSANNLSLPLPSVSRHHATLLREGESFFLRDEGSHNGTYLNGRKVSGQVEVRAGDEISLGKAVLLLRSTGTEPGLATATSIAVPERPWIKLAIFGAAVVLGVITVFVFASLRSPSDPAPVAQQPEPVAVVPAPQRGRPAPADPRPESSPTPEKKPADTSLVGDSEVSASKVFAEAREKGAPPVDEIEPPKSLERRQVKRPKRHKRKHKQKTGVDSPEARALFENGDIDSAYAAAKRAGANDLASKIASFKKELAAAKADLSFKDGAGAIRHFTAALALEDDISDGWSALGGEIRVQLSKLYELAGLKEIERGEHAKASAYLERALKYDPSNAKAKQFLRKLKATPTYARSAADEAFGN